MTTDETGYGRHYEEVVALQAEPEDVFSLVDDHSWLSSHMSSSSWMMAGGSMTLSTDDARGQAVGSHITMTGAVLGIRLSLDEVVTARVPPWEKRWETRGVPRLLVIGAYRMGFRIAQDGETSRFTMFIDYDLPAKRRWLGLLLGGVYAHWCVSRVAAGVEQHFRTVASAAAG